MKIVDRVHALTLEALDDCTDAQRTMYTRVHGITQHGMTNSEVAADVARDIGITRQAAHERLMAARIAVYSHIAQHLIAEQAEREAALEMPCLGVTTIDHHHALDTFVRYSVRSEQRVTLGAGSEAMENAEKSQSRNTATPLRVAVHQAYARTQDAA